MEDIYEDRIEKDAVASGPGVNRNRNHATDKYWTVLFIVVAIIWMTVEPRVKSDGKFNVDNSTIANYTSKFVPNEKNGMINSFINISDTPKDKKPMWDTLIRNLHFLDGNYDNSNFIVILVNILFCSCLIVYFVTKMREDEVYSKFRGVSTFTIFLWTFLMRLILMIEGDLADLSWSLFLWWLPDLIFILLCNKEWPINNSEYVNENLRKLNPGCVHYAILCSFPIMVYSVLIKTVCQWVNSTDLIAELATLYIFMTIYYFLLMATSCASALSAKLLEPDFEDLIRALYIVARYHFGTVCYHATLILPRIHATFVVNEKEFRENSKISAMRRFYLTHWKFPNISSTLTAVRGHSHSESVRELMRLFAGDSTKTKDLQIHNKMLRRISVLLMAINILTYMSLWAHGVTIDPRLSIAPWLAYLWGYCIAYLQLKFMDVASDALWFHNYGDIGLEV